MSKLSEDLRKWIRGYRSGRIWINKLRSGATIDSYLPNFKRFCKLAITTPDELLNLKMEGMKAIGTTKEFQAEELYEETIKNMVEKGHPQASMATAVLSFFKHN